MKSRLTKDNSRISGEKNDVQPIRGRATNWNEMKFKISGDAKNKKAPEGATGADIFKKENYQKDKK